MRGYFGIGIENCKTSENLGTLWRSAYNLGAGFIFVIGKRFQHQCSDTTKAWKNIPLFQYQDFDEFYENLPYSCRLVGVEFPHAKARPLAVHVHDERCAYILGAEDRGLSQKTLAHCQSLVYIPSLTCLNVAVAGSIIMYDRKSKRGES